MILAALLLLTMAVPVSAAEPRVQRTELQVTNLTCSSCLVRLRWKLTKLDGVVDMQADPRKNIVRIDHTEALPPEAIAETMNDLGYPATLVGSRDLQGNESQADRRRRVCGPTGCSNSRPCNATAGAWRKLIDRWFGDDGTGRNRQP